MQKRILDLAHMSLVAWRFRPFGDVNIWFLLTVLTETFVLNRWISKLSWKQDIESSTLADGPLLAARLDLDRALADRDSSLEKQGGLAMMVV